MIKNVMTEAAMAMELAKIILYVEFAVVALALVAFVARLVTPHVYRVTIGQYFRQHLHID
jgi:hypothetical protein